MPRNAPPLVTAVLQEMDLSPRGEAPAQAHASCEWQSRPSRDLSRATPSPRPVLESIPREARALLVWLWESPPLSTWAMAARRLRLRLAAGTDSD